MCRSKLSPGQLISSMQETEAKEHLILLAEHGQTEIYRDFSVQMPYGNKQPG